MSLKSYNAIPLNYYCCWIEDHGVFLPAACDFCFCNPRRNTHNIQSESRGEYHVPGRGSSFISHSAAGAELKMHKLFVPGFAPNELGEQSS